MTHEFKHPKYWREMRKLQAASDKPYQINYDDFCKGDEEAPSIKPQASSIKLGGPAHNQAPSLVKKKI